MAEGLGLTGLCCDDGFRAAVLVAGGMLPGPVLPASSMARGLAAVAVIAWPGCEPSDLPIAMTAPTRTITVAITLVTMRSRGGQRRCQKLSIAGPRRAARRFLGRLTGFGKPSWPNGPARWATVVRCARPVGVSSVQIFRIRPVRAAGRAVLPPASAAAGASLSLSALAMSRRWHSLRATASSQEPSRPGALSPASFSRATTNVSVTAPAASPPGSRPRQ
ncbi:MAG TPA: hypothetical protein VN969_29435 [Streptosporangiaceae bacterium]|nr:hypothetical protein [Streptosporangiaceae bacterium]